MSDARNRSWRELAEAACADNDPEKLIRIVEELNRVLEQRAETENPRRRSSRITSEDSSVAPQTADGSRLLHFRFSSKVRPLPEM